MSRTNVAFLCAIAVLAVGCQSPPPDETGPPERDGKASKPAVARGTASPDTTGPALWSWLQEEAYRETWDLWPGRDPLYAGTEPHGALLTTYVNPIAREALRRGDEAMPPGAIVVKENYLPDSTLAAITVMLQARGYDARHQDWFWAKFGSEGEIEAAGRVEACAGCHGAEPDYLFSGDLGAPSLADSVVGG